MHLEAGQPRTGAPSKVIEASRKMLDAEVLGYTPAAGILALRERIAEHYKEKYDVEVQANRVMVTTGSSGGFPLIFLAGFDVGDRVAVASSSYPCYRNVLNALGCEVMTIPTDDQYKVTAGAVVRFVDLLKEEQKGADADNNRPLKGLILSSPSNPTGTMLSPEEIEDMVKVCEERGIVFISDEIYHGICYDKVAQTALAYSDQCYVINSFSKFYSMTGWRLGWMVVPEHMVETIKCLAMNFFISAPTLSQLSAAVAAFECEDELMKHVKMYKTNREILWRGLSSIGFTNIAPSDGGFYMYVDVSELVEDSTVLAADMLEEAGVAVTSGVDFEDPSTGVVFVEISSI
ncbi:unnamed protein product [Ascophyllum nodosum]